ncbi:putative Glutamate synthase (NADH), chloroplast precursor (NADH-GOGAT) [Bradyrhizobium sp. ORS 285]|nr:putative Glutamate synthase (NADH), chloroplast precursor (NADH-GOGAT) [Bradyrhizobium sp. ORS 285]
MPQAAPCGYGSRLKAGTTAEALARMCGAPRDLPIPGRDLSGVHDVMDVLPQQNRRACNERVNATEMPAVGKPVVVIGGGSGSDSIERSDVRVHRHSA